VTTAPAVALAIETATGDTEVALADAGGTLAEAAVRRARRHVESLHPAIQQVCAAAGVDLGAVSAIGVDIGPGLFTGLRVGVTAAKMLAAGLGIPLVTMTSLELLALAGAPFCGPDDLVVPVVDMRRGEVAWQAGGPVTVSPPADLGRALAALLAGAGGPGPSGRILLVGEGAAVRAEAILAAAGPEGAARLQVAGVALATPPARLLAGETIVRAAAGATADPLSCVPLYLREADAAINWESRPERPVQAAAQPAETVA
jgi:tRNA threonylcarbamoyladenosine biosynthesis protein TsaB